MNHLSSVLFYCTVIIFWVTGTGISVSQDNDDKQQNGEVNDTIKNREAKDTLKLSFAAINHPKNYVSLYEHTHDNKRLTIFSSKNYRETGIDSSINYEIDIRSKLVVKFETVWLRNNYQNLNLNVTVNANLKNVPLTVPGYSKIGESLRLARYSKATLGYLVSLFNFNYEAQLLLRSLNITFEILYTTEDNEKYLDRIYDKPFVSDDEADFNTAYDSFINNNDTDAYRAIVRLAIKRNNSVHRFLTLWPDIGKTLRLIQSGELKWYLPILASITENDPIIIENSAKTIAIDYIVRLKEIDTEIRAMVLSGLVDSRSSDNKTKINERGAARLSVLFFEEGAIARSIEKSIRTLLQDKNDFTYFSNRTNPSKGILKISREQTLGLLKETELIIDRTPAKVNDAIDFNIVNSNSASGSEQIFNVRLVVKQFGLKRSVKDSFMFFKRYRVAPDDIISDANTDNPKTEGPAPVNFEPYSGLSMIWSHYDRENKFLRILHPGIGFNVSFPRFGTDISTFTPDGTGGGTVGTVNSSTKTDLGVSFGAVLSIFDGALQLSGGWMLKNADEKREYYSIGFSFIKAAEGIQAVID